MKIQRLAALVLLSSLSVVAVGCGDGVERPKVGQVTGKVTLDGKPFEGVNVMFQGEGGHTSVGSVDDEGNYELIYDEKTKGAKTGPNTVKIAYPTGETGPIVPLKYSVRAPKGEKVTVTVEAGANTFDFELKSDNPGANEQEPVVD